MLPQIRSESSPLDHNARHGYKLKVIKPWLADKDSANRFSFKIFPQSRACSEMDKQPHSMPGRDECTY